MANRRGSDANSGSRHYGGRGPARARRLRLRHREAGNRYRRSIGARSPGDRRTAGAKARAVVRGRSSQYCRHAEQIKLTLRVRGERDMQRAPIGRAVAITIGLMMGASTTVLAQTLKPFVVTEPVHSMDSVPFYLAVKKGFFKEAGLDVEVVTAE